jgi:hypothetical protein
MSRQERECMLFEARERGRSGVRKERKGSERLAGCGGKRGDCVAELLRMAQAVTCFEMTYMLQCCVGERLDDGNQTHKQKSVRQLTDAAIAAAAACCCRYCRWHERAQVSMKG